MRTTRDVPARVASAESISPRTSDRSRIALAAVIALVALAAIWVATRAQPAANPVAQPDQGPVADTAGGESATGRPAAQAAADPTEAVPKANPLLNRPRGPLSPREGVLLGLWNRPLEWTAASERQGFEERERQLGRPMDIAHSYYDWQDPFPTWRETWHQSQGRIPLVSWGPADPGAIAAGKFDELLKRRARDVAALDSPFFLRWFWEMDMPQTEGLTYAPDEYVAAWRHIRETFQEEGAVNAVWVWCPTADAFQSAAARRWYPGDAYVDWVCADGYNWAPQRVDAEWRSFRSIFRAAHEFGTAHGKPLMVAEFGVQERDPGEKAAWLRQIPAALDDMPGIAALVYFDANREYDWRLDTSGSALQAFADVGTTVRANLETLTVE